MAQILFLSRLHMSISGAGYLPVGFCWTKKKKEKKKDDTGLERRALGPLLCLMCAVVCGHLCEVCIVHLYIRPKAMHTVLYVWLYKCIQDVHLRPTQNVAFSKVHFKMNHVFVLLFQCDIFLCNHMLSVSLQWWHFLRSFDSPIWYSDDHDRRPALKQFVVTLLID